MAKGEPVKWITVKGRRVPIYEDGSMGGFMEGKKATSKQEDDKKSGKKTYRVYFEDGNQKLLEANSEEELDAYLKENEKKIGKATKREHAKEYDEKKEDFVKDFDLQEHLNKKGAEEESKRKARETADENDAYDREHKEGKYADDISKKGSKSLEDHSDIQKIAEEHVKKIWNGGATNRELYDAAEKWAEEHNFDKTKAKDAAFTAMNKKQMAEIKRRESEKGSNTSGSDYIISQNSEGQELKIPRKTYEDRLKRAKEYQENLRGMKGTTPDDHKRAREQVEELENALKTGKSIKVGDKKISVNKNKYALTDEDKQKIKDSVRKSVHKNAEIERALAPYKKMTRQELVTNLVKAGVDKRDLIGWSDNELRKWLLGINSKK